jgi:hypothetical protein
LDDSKTKTSSKGICCRGKAFRIYPHQLIYGFGGGQVMAYRADATKSLNQYRGLPVRVSLDKALEAPEFNDMEIRLIYLSLLVQVNGYPSVSLNACDGVYDDLSAHISSFSRI